MISTHFSVPSPSVILNEWTLEQMYDAHALLDLLEKPAPKT